MKAAKVAVIVGAGPGLGFALAQRFAHAEMSVALVVADVVIDGRTGPAGGEASASMLDSAAIAEAYYQLHCQSRSAWTQELDLRPWCEKF